MTQWYLVSLSSVWRHTPVKQACLHSGSCHMGRLSSQCSNSSACTRLLCYLPPKKIAQEKGRKWHTKEWHEPGAGKLNKKYGMSVARNDSVHRSAAITMNRSGPRNCKTAWGTPVQLTRCTAAFCSLFEPAVQRSTLATLHCDVITNLSTSVAASCAVSRASGSRAKLHL